MATLTTTKTAHFNIAINNLEIISGTYQVYGIVNGHLGSITRELPFQGDTFSIAIGENESEYYAVVALVETYTLDGVSYTVEDKTINLLATFFLPDLSYPISICPESTIASIYCFARMTTVNNDGFIDMKGTKRNMKIAYGMKQNFYETEGRVANMIKQSPNGFETNSYPMFNSLCNLLYYCLTDTTNAFYNQFLDYAWHEAGTTNNSFLEAVRNMLHDPFTNAKEIYQMLVGKDEVYVDSLTTMDVRDDKKAPNNWTLTLKSNSSGSMNFIPSGLAYVVFDADDNAWIGNNFRAGSSFSATHALVYKYNATPASFSPVQGGGLLGVGFGTAIDNEKKYISFGNFGWGPVLNNPQEGSISRFYYEDGTAISPPNGITNGVSRVQGMNYDNAGNLWMASIGCQDPFAPAPTGDYPFEDENSAVVVYLNGDPENILICNEFPIKQSASDANPVFTSSPYLKVFDVFPDPNNPGIAYVSCIGTYDKDNPDKCVLSSVYRVAINNDSLVVTNWWFSDYTNKIDNQTGFESLRQVTMNGEGDVVVVGVESNRATVLYNDLSGVKTYYDTNTYGPWGVKIDKADTVFLASFRQEAGRAHDQTLDMQGPFGVTILRDASNPNSAQLLTLPTGGSEVTLANGYPLYGTLTRSELNNGEASDSDGYFQMKSYEPLMRLTSTNIDGAGNLWCMNNWKPSAKVDVKDNPGGDGPVIFIGIAEPE